MIDFINKQLKEKYGVDLYGNPFYRIVFSDDQFEKRFGVYNEFYGQIFIREIKGLKETQKYNYLHHKFVLEKRCPASIAYDPQIPETSQGSYEPIYVFQDKNGHPLSPVYQVAERIIYTLEHPLLPGVAKCKMETQEAVELEKEIQESMDIMENENPYLVGKLHAKEAILRP